MKSKLSGDYDWYPRIMSNPARIKAINEIAANAKPKPKHTHIIVDENWSAHTADEWIKAFEETKRK